MNGPGRYDAATTAARIATAAEGVILIVFNGVDGSGFSAQLTARQMRGIPDILRDVADQIEHGEPSGFSIS